MSWVWCWVVARRCLSRKAVLGRSSQLQRCPSAWLFAGKWVLVEIPSHLTVRMMKCHSCPGKLLPGSQLHVRHDKRDLHQEQIVLRCPADGWVHKKAGKMLLPDSFSLVATFCKVPAQKEISGFEAVLGRVKPALSKSGARSCGESPGSFSFL